MSVGNPRIERWLVLGQALGALALGIAWWRSASTGWPEAGLALSGLGVALAGAAYPSLRRAFRVGPIPQPGTVLVCTGIYRWVRHPMYVGALLVFAAAVTSRPSTGVTLAVAFNATWYLVKASYEESLLLAHFPDYAAYRRRTVGLPIIRMSRPPGES